MSLPLPLHKINDEVFIATDEVVHFDVRAIDFIKQCAIQNARGRVRICAHKHQTDTLHEMLIAIRSDSYIRPHRHHHKAESFHLIDGAADVVVMDEEGAITDIVELDSQHNFYYRLDSPRYHTLLIHSPVLVIHEITNGPFDPSQNDWAGFSPAEGTPEAAIYIERLRSATATRKAAPNRN